MTNIRNHADLLNYYGREATGDLDADDRVLSRAVYKNTECGAWAKLLAAGRRQVGTCKETWTAAITPSLVGPTVVAVRKRGGKRLPVNEAPPHVREFLMLTNADQPAVIQGMTYEEVVALPPNSGTTDKVTSREGVVFVTFTIDAPVYERHAGGVSIGSIVEGSDAEVMPETLYYPFTVEHLEAAIQGVEEAADFFWRRDNLDADDPDHPGVGAEWW